MKFDFDESCKAAFEEIKSKLVTAPIMVSDYYQKVLFYTLINTCFEHFLHSKQSN